VYQAIATLRRLLGDDAKQPRYIATVPRLGYRLVASVSPWSAEPVSTAASASVPTARRSWGALLTAGAALCLALATALLLQSGVVRSLQTTTATPAPPNSVAVLPFLDLTSQAMDQEFFADGMTEELIDRLSKIATLHVAPPTSSFYFKDKNWTLREMAASLRVAYIVDGSLRKSESTLRIAARLVRASDGFVVWSETFDRPIGDELKVQDEIAAAVTQVLAASIH
jgi:transcriptional activator of cad operon